MQFICWDTKNTIFGFCIEVQNKCKKYHFSKCKSLWILLRQIFVKTRIWPFQSNSKTIADSMKTMLNDKILYFLSNFSVTILSIKKYGPQFKCDSLTVLQLVMGRTPFHGTSNKLERLFLFVIELEHPIFGFERSNIELQT